MRQKIITANWKLNMLRPETRSFAERFLALLGDGDFEPDCEIVLAPPFTALDSAQEAFAGTDIALAGQNVSSESSGAFTGEVSAAMLKEVGCRYCIVGHSERRALFGETDDIVARKVTALLEVGIRPIVCVGETLAERESDRTEKVLASQLDGSLAGRKPQDAQQIILAYEPVWAIGTGHTATPQQAQETHAFIREHLGNSEIGEGAESLRIQYGGSVKPDNAAAILAEPDIDGALVGGASLNPDHFAQIVRFDQPEKTSS